MDSIDTNNFEKTVYQSTSVEELTKIYEMEMNTFRKNELILNALGELKPENFTSKNIEKSLMSYQIGHITIPGNKIFGLYDFDISKITLSYSEKKLVKDQVEQALLAEVNTPSNVLEIVQESRDLLIQKEKERQEETIKLAALTKVKLELTNKCAEIRVGPNQINLVDKILQDSMMNEVTLKGFQNTLLQNLKDDTYQGAAKQVEKNIEILIEKQNDK